MHRRAAIALLLAVGAVNSAFFAAGADVAWSAFVPPPPPPYLRLLALLCAFVCFGLLCRLLASLE